MLKMRCYVYIGNERLYCQCWKWHTARNHRGVNIGLYGLKWALQCEQQCGAEFNIHCTETQNLHIANLGLALNSELSAFMKAVWKAQSHYIKCQKLVASWHLLPKTVNLLTPPNDTYTAATRMASKENCKRH